MYSWKFTCGWGRSGLLSCHSVCNESIETINASQYSSWIYMTQKVPDPVPLVFYHSLQTWTRLHRLSNSLHHCMNHSCAFFLSVFALFFRPYEKMPSCTRPGCPDVHSYKCGSIHCLVSLLQFPRFLLTCLLASCFFDIFIARVFIHFFNVCFYFIISPAYHFLDFLPHVQVQNWDVWLNEGSRIFPSILTLQQRTDCYT